MSPSPSILELLETPDAFREWLRTKKPLEVVGEKGSNRCPLAQFLRSHRPETRCEVGRNHFWVAWGRPIGLIAWASNFVHAADYFMADSEAGPYPRIHAVEALDLLDESASVTSFAGFPGGFVSGEKELECQAVRPPTAGNGAGRSGLRNE